MFYNWGAGGNKMKKNGRPLINEESLEHGLMFCLKYKEQGKTLDDVIEHLKNRLSVIKQKKFEKNEAEVHS